MKLDYVINKMINDVTLVAMDFDFISFKNLKKK